MNKVYGKGSRLIVCFKGSHFVSPSDTRVSSTERVRVVPGESADTVCVNGEVWSLKGSYTGAKGSTKRWATAPQGADPGASASHCSGFQKPVERVYQRIKEVAPNSNAECTMRVCYENWLRGCTWMTLYKGLNFDDPSVTKAVHALGEEIMAEFGDKR